MIKLVKYRAALITVLFGLFGAGLSSLLKIDDLKTIYTAISLLISLVISLLVSFLLKLKKTKKTRNNIKLISLFLMLFLLVSIFMYIKAYNTRTFSYRDNNTRELTYYVKGTELQPKAVFISDMYLKQEGKRISDEVLVLKFGGPLHADDAWTPDTIKSNRFYLIVNYICIIIFFVSIVCLLIEVLVVWYPKSTAKAIEETDEKKIEDERNNSV